MSLLLSLNRWPTPPSGPELSVRDVALLDLARHCARQAALPAGTIEDDVQELWDVLRAEADAMAADVSPEPAVDVLEPIGLAWARERGIIRS